MGFGFGFDKKNFVFIFERVGDGCGGAVDGGGRLWDGGFSRRVIAILV